MPVIRGFFPCFPYAAAQPLGMSNPFYSGCYRSWEVYLGRGFGIFLRLSPGLSSSSSATSLASDVLACDGILLLAQKNKRNTVHMVIPHPRPATPVSKVRKTV